MNSGVSTNESARLKKRTYDLIRYLYKNMPYYNQLKGTYTGMQMILNMMGLCASITELWSDRKPDALGNFVENANFYRADVLHSVRQRINDWGNATVGNYYLTSRFDIDVVHSKSMSFSQLNDISTVVLNTVEQIKPLTSCLAELRYILQVNSKPLHIEYILRYGSKSVKDGNIEVVTYKYTWHFQDIFNPTGPYAGKTRVFRDHVETIFLPWTADTCRGSIANTDCNSYFVLNDAGKKMKESTGAFKFTVNSTTEFEFAIDTLDGVEIITESNGLMIRFNGTGPQACLIGTSPEVDIDISVAVPLGYGRLWCT